MKVAHCIHLNQLTLQIPDAEQYPMEFSVISNARSFTAMANSVEERDEWVEAIHTAKVNYEENLKTFKGMRPRSEIGLAMTLGDIAPVWIPDDRVTACQVRTGPSQSDPDVAALPHVVWDQTEASPLPGLRESCLQCGLEQRGSPQTPQGGKGSGL